MSSPDQEELDIRRVARLLTLRREDKDIFRRVAVEMKLRAVPADLRAQAERRLGGEGGAKDTAAALSPAELAKQVETEVQVVMGDLAPDNLGSLAAELGIDESELATLIGDLPDNFEQLVADEVKSTLESSS